ncbi:hypothetical protein MNBD_IGNAVI01-2956 [hydrothermal vent metagenome]|uniref:FlgD/Vpr Ig-like domain-containing protein n=1 Tax=hydrothermal vent metagenome TaxID=652676 RepID=A0A3B1CU18_9ZZZZ
MKKFKLLFLIFIPLQLSIAQSSFKVDDYQNFLQENKNLTAEQLLELHNAGEFKPKINTSNWVNAFYHDSVEIKLKLTEGEKSLIKKNGFVVSERLSQGSFGQQFEEIFHSDLPLYISSDAVLHAFHASYDKILKETELNILIDRVTTLLENLSNSFGTLEAKYNNDDSLKQMLKDLDVYLTVPRKLFDISDQPYYSDNTGLVDSLLVDINSYSALTKPLFSKTSRKIDFSQFKPRGHYDDENFPELAKYFKVMMWFGRIELYLIAPKSFDTVPITDVQRQIIISRLFSELVDLSNSRELFDEIEFIIRTFVGEQDNVTLPDLEETFIDAGITDIHELLDTLIVRRFQDTLKVKSFAGQKILSQILMHDPMSPDKIEPASAFMPFGQRFIIDSYITGNVVYDRVKSMRMLPSTLDILFALGNDAAAQLLKEELDKYKYSPNLVALRYLIDNYDFDFWNNSIYNLWLNSIKVLNPPADRTYLPQFMQTAAWWQQKINTQLASWTELRHDNLLYAKQSYSGGVTCSYPYSYVEPVPQFFSAIKILADNTLEKLLTIPSYDNWVKEKFKIYFNHLSGVADTLSTIAQKELDNVPFSNEEKWFLERVLYNNPQQVCGGPRYIGWFPSLYYGDSGQAEFHKEDYLVADYHTAPTDAGGAMVGWVKHAGTGKVDLMILNTKLPDGTIVAFVGPVFSYHEYTTTNFYRLTDSEWQTQYLAQSTRPEWTNIYLADINGNVKPEGLNLITGIDENEKEDPIIPETHLVAQNYPNPFNPSTSIAFTIPSRLTNSRVSLIIYDIQGNRVKELVNETMQSGHYLIEWNGKSDLNQKVSSGVYFYEVRVNTERFVGKMNLIK